QEIEDDPANITRILWVAGGAAVICWLQFSIGWFIGKKHNNRIVGGQGLGQKNTILAIWMADTFFNPLVAIAPASYVVWQNLINSYQLWKYQRKQNKIGG
ncbi:MAG: transporter, partial [Dysgonamonadaceae bacterium]|nr:transporter [Dysgonamonadaceae bacterium]